MTAEEFMDTLPTFPTIGEDEYYFDVEDNEEEDDTED